MLVTGIPVSLLCCLNALLLRARKLYRAASNRAVLRERCPEGGMQSTVLHPWPPLQMLSPALRRGDTHHAHIMQVHSACPGSLEGSKVLLGKEVPDNRLLPRIHACRGTYMALTTAITSAGAVNCT